MCLYKILPLCKYKSSAETNTIQVLTWIEIGMLYIFQSWTQMKVCALFCFFKRN